MISYTYSPCCIALEVLCKVSAKSNAAQRFDLVFFSIHAIASLLRVKVRILNDPLNTCHSLVGFSPVVLTQKPSMGFTEADDLV